MIILYVTALLAVGFPSHCAGHRIKRQDESIVSCSTHEGGIGKCLTLIDCPSYKEAEIDVDNTENSTVLERSKCVEGEVCCAAEEGEVTERIGAVKGGVCGRSAVRQSNRVVGGQPADLGAWPWIAALGYRPTVGHLRSLLWTCGGSLISKRFVLTAAHCIRVPDHVPIALTTVRLGEHDLANDTEGATHMDFGIEYTIVHRNYKRQTNDIGLVRLDRDVSFTDRIRPICLPSADHLRGENFEKKFPFVAGWGATQFRGSVSSVLLQVQVPVVSNEICRRAYSQHGSIITGTQLCAGDLKGGKDSCSGDSGGPLMLPQSGVYYQIGVVSFGHKCAEPGFPGVYTRVTSYLDWIRANALDLE